jgi:hypothetical protein
MGTMPTQAHQTYRLRHAPLIAAARLDCMVRPYARRLSRPAVCGIGLVAVAIAAIAYLRGAELHAGITGGQPPLLPRVTSVNADDRA